MQNKLILSADRFRIMNIESQISFNCVTFEAKYIGMGKVLNSCQVYFPCYCKTSNIGKGQIEVLTSYCF